MFIRLLMAVVPDISIMNPPIDDGSLPNRMCTTDESLNYY